MTTGEGHGSEFHNRSDILGVMQDIAPSGQAILDSGTIHGLRRYTGRLIEISGQEAEAEYDRFVGITERGLDLHHGLLQDQLQGKTVMVTGGTGCIGSSLLREVVKYDPANVISVSRGIMIPRQTTEGVNYTHADLRSAEDITEVIAKNKPDVIYHLAAQHDPSLAESEVGRTLATNIFGTRNVINAARRADVQQLVYASTGKAIRPYTPDTYASSKKAGEWLMADTAARTEITCAGVRFTHVVDNSIIFRRIQDWIDHDSPIRLHGPNILFYMQSARESAHLLLDAGIEARSGQLQLETIRDLEWPVNLTDLALGSLIRREADTPIYIAGYEEGYEEVPYPGLYDPMYSGERSPLINAWEAPDAVASPTCPQVDLFPFNVGGRSSVQNKMAELESAIDSGSSNNAIKRINHELSWELLDSRLGVIGRSILARSAQRMARYPNYNNLPDEHIRTDIAVQRALARAIE